eukprot:5299753-Pleurochrysis_carterae.AAC.1
MSGGDFVDDADFSVGVRATSARAAATQRPRRTPAHDSVHEVRKHVLDAAVSSNTSTDPSMRLQQQIEELQKQ